MLCALPQALWHLSGIPHAAQQMVRHGALSVLVSLLSSSNFSAVETAAGALWNLSIEPGVKVRPAPAYPRSVRCPLHQLSS